jgi:hypothetical protein
MSAPEIEQVTVLQDLRNAQVARALAEDRLREYQQAEQEIARLNSDLYRAQRAARRAAA